MKEIIYIRTSTEEQEPENQVSDCKTLTKSDCEIAREQQSAFKDKDRPIFESIRQRIKKGEVTDLIVWDLDRVYRQRKKLIEFFDFCKVYKCKIHSFRQQWLEQLNNIPEPFNEMMHGLMLQVMGWLAEEESTKKSQRVKLAVRKSDGKDTKSYKGNKWGRKSIQTNRLKEDVLKLKETGLTIREIVKQVYYYDKNNNKKNPSRSLVHKLLKESSVQNE